MAIHTSTKPPPKWIRGIKVSASTKRVAGEMIVEDPFLVPYIQGEELLVKVGTVFFVLVVTGMIKIWKKRDA